MSISVSPKRASSVCLCSKRGTLCCQVFFCFPLPVYVRSECLCFPGTFTTWYTAYYVFLCRLENNRHRTSSDREFLQVVVVDHIYLSYHAHVARTTFLTLPCMANHCTKQIDAGSAAFPPQYSHDALPISRGARVCSGVSVSLISRRSRVAFPSVPTVHSAVY